MDNLEATTIALNPENGGMTQYVETSFFRSGTEGGNLPRGRGGLQEPVLLIYLAIHRQLQNENVWAAPMFWSLN
jgi:hypothetical protein